MRSLARAFSSSRRAPPMQASKPNSAIASSSVTDWCGLRLSSGAFSTTRPDAIESSTERTISRSPSSAARAGRGRRSPRESCGRCRRAAAETGKRPGRNAFSASRSSTSESLPPEKSRAGFWHWPATSRRMWIASDSSHARWSASAGANASVRPGRRLDANGVAIEHALIHEFTCSAMARPGGREWTRDGYAGRIPCVPGSPTTSARRGCPRLARPRACRARSRCWDSRDRAARCTARRACGRSPRRRRRSSRPAD